MPLNPTVRSRLEAQGFCGLDEEALDELAPWMRWTYTLGMLVTIIGVAMTAPVVLWSLAAVTAVGVILPFDPFDLLYNYGFRHVTGTRPFPKSGPQRHFLHRREHLAGCDRLGVLPRCGHPGLRPRSAVDLGGRAGQYHEFLHSVIHLQHRSFLNKSAAKGRV